MEVGLRVVRGPDWMWGDQDGGEGNVGTVIQLGGDENLPENTVLVYWDSGKQANYRAGYSGKYDLRVFDSAQTGVNHILTICDGCNQNPVIGIRWKCANCDNYNLCSSCFTSDVHDMQHEFLRFDTPQGNGMPVGKRSDAVKVQSKGLFPGAKVSRGRDWKWADQDGGNGEIGTLTEITAWSGVERSGAKVIWNTLGNKMYRVGYQGSVDLKCSTPANGPSYYRECLANVGDKQVQEDTNRLRVGDRVSVCLDAEVLKAMSEGHGCWVDGMEQCIGKVGKIKKIDDDGDVHISYGLLSWVFHPDAVIKLPSFQAGDKVRVVGDRQLVENLQQGHGGWNETMTAALGKEGKVLEVDSDGDVVVMVGTDFWMFNPAALEDLTGGEATARRGETSPGSPVDNLDDHLKMLLLEAALKGSGGDPGDRLVSASSNGNLQDVVEILEANPDKIDHKVAGKTALHVACHQGHTEIVKYLLNNGADKDITDEEDYSALHHAAYGDKSGETVTVMLNTGTNVNVCDIKTVCTPLHLAVKQGNDAGVKALLLSWHCDVNCQDLAGDTPLHDAISEEKNGIIDLILSSEGLDITVSNYGGFNPLHQACKKGNKHAVKKISDKFPGLIGVAKEDGFTALHLAACNNHIEITKILLLSGHCDVNVRNYEGQTALALAVSKAYTGMIELLIENGADINAEDEDGDTPLHLAIINQAVCNTDLRGLLQGLGMDLPAVDTDQHTRSAIAVYLALHGADINFYNQEGKTPLDLCLDPKTVDLIKQFARTGPSRTASSRSSTFSQPRPQPVLTESMPQAVPMTAPAPAPVVTPLSVPSAVPSATTPIQKNIQDAVNRGDAAEVACKLCDGKPASVTSQPCGHKMFCSADKLDDLHKMLLETAALKGSGDDPDLLVPSEIKARGLEALRAYNKALMNGKVKVYRTRIMLIGQDRTGKTSLKKSLLGLPFDPEEQSTVGIEVDPSSFNIVVEQVENWQRSNKKIGVSQFSQELARMVAEELTKEEPLLKTSHMNQNVQEAAEIIKNHPTGGQDENVTTEERTSVSDSDSHSIRNILVQDPGYNTERSLPSQEVTEYLIHLLRNGLSLHSDNSPTEPVIDVDLWDFAGQHLYYASHSVFFSKRAVYILVCNLSKGLKHVAEPCVRQGIHGVKRLENPNGKTNLDDLMSWLVSVSATCPKNQEKADEELPYLRPPIFIVGTHADIPFEDVKEMKLQIQQEISGKDYESHVIHPIITVDNTQSSSDPGVCQLKKEITNVLNLEPYVGEEVPVRWLNFEKVVQALASKETHYLNLEELKTIVQEVCVIEDENEIGIMLDFYHDLGMIVKHGNTVVLQAQWLIDVFKKLITIPPFSDMESKHSKNWKLLEEEGVLRMDLVRRAFSKYTLQGSATERDVLSMMERFGLIAEFATSPNDVNYFVPAQLRAPSPEDLCDKVASSWDPCPLYLDFLSRFVPHGFFPHLVSRCILWCSENKFKHLPRLFACAAKFFIGNPVTHQLILLCKKRFIKIVLNQVDPDHQALLADGEVGSFVVKFLKDTLQDLPQTLPWFSNVETELSVACPLCPTRKCLDHDQISCTHENCLCLHEMVSPGEQLFCRKSGKSFKVPRMDQWFPSRVKLQVAKDTVQLSDEAMEVPLLGGGNYCAPAHCSGDISVCQGISQVKQGIPLDDELEGLSAEIGDKWKQLGRRLNFKESELQGIHIEHDQLREKGYHMLMHWKQANGSSATYHVLSNALQHKLVQRQDLAELFCYADVHTSRSFTDV